MNNELKIELEELKEKETLLAQKDATMKDCMFYDALYSKVSEKQAGWSLMLYLNKYFNSVGLSLNLMFDDNGVKYYTINGGQFLAAVNRDKRTVFGRLLREHITNTDISFSDKRSLIFKHLIKKYEDKRNGNLNKKGSRLYKQIINHFIPEKILDEVFSEKNKRFVEKETLLNNIIFQARWNDLDAVKNLIDNK